MHCGGGAWEMLVQNVRNSVVPAFARACPSVAACSFASCTQRCFAVRRVLKRHFVVSLPCLRACSVCWACLLCTKSDLQFVAACKCMVCKSLNIDERTKHVHCIVRTTPRQSEQNRKHNYRSMYGRPGFAHVLFFSCSELLTSATDLDCYHISNAGTGCSYTCWLALFYPR